MPRAAISIPRAPGAVVVLWALTSLLAFVVAKRYGQRSGCPLCRAAGSGRTWSEVRLCEGCECAKRGTSDTPAGCARQAGAVELREGLLPRSVFVVAKRWDERSGCRLCPAARSGRAWNEVRLCEGCECAKRGTSDTPAGCARQAGAVGLRGRLVSWLAFVVAKRCYEQSGCPLCRAARSGGTSRG